MTKICSSDFSPSIFFFLRCCLTEFEFDQVFSGSRSNVDQCSLGSLPMVGIASLAE